MNLLPLLAALTWPPSLPDNSTIHTGSSDLLLQPTETLKEGVEIAKAAPKVEFLYYGCQAYDPEGGLWSSWGDGLVVGDTYYSSIGDHCKVEGNAFLYAYNSKTKGLKESMDLKSVLKQPPGQYVPGKIHSRIDMGKDGWLYYSTHRGSTRIAFMPEANFKGDWILRHHPGSGRTEVVAHAPLELQSLPCGQLDPDRLIFYAGTADGLKKKDPQFLAYDIQGRKVLFSSDQGPARSMVLARSTGKLYFHTSNSGAAQLLRFDPGNPGLTPINATVGLRAASEETRKGIVYTVDRDQLWAFDSKTETAKELGKTAVGTNDYITSLDLDPKTQRYLYYIPGAHGGAHRDGSPLVQYDLKTNTRKVICFLHPYLHKATGYIPMGAYMSAVSADGDKVYITWNGNRGVTQEDLDAGKNFKFNTCALTVIHIPEPERRP